VTLCDMFPVTLFCTLAGPCHMSWSICKMSYVCHCFLMIVTSAQMNKFDVAVVFPVLCGAGPWNCNDCTQRL